VDDLLELTRIRQNRIKLKKESINLGELLENMSRDMNLAYREKGVRLHVELPEEPLFLDADPVRIAQCAGNLLQNALDFTPAQGEVTLSLAYEKEEAVIRVRDNGVGISPGLLKHIFKPFTQADTTLDRTNSGGLGLGLSIVAGIVQMHGGRVAAFSEGEGKGALFTIKLPVMARPRQARNSGAGQKQIRNLRILVIDDKRELTDILCAMLGAMGHRARAAYDGDGGIAAAKEIRPDVIFCDIGLPGRSGYGVAEILKADRELKNAYLVALTGYAGEDEKERAKAAGFDRHLAKPVDRAALEKVLTEIIGKR
jgi:CheY-like chemotaxis protein